MDLGLQDKVVIVTGAGSGIGLETAKRFLEEGAKVVGASLQSHGVESGGWEGASHYTHVKGDLSISGQENKIVDAALDQYGRVDILFNNAATCPSRQGFLEVTDDDWNATFNLNLVGYVRMARAVIPQMIKQGKGVIVHSGSEAGRMPHPLLPDYNVSKAAIAMLSKILSREFTSKGIRSNVVAPAHVRTELWDKPGGFLESLATKYGTSKEDAVEAFLADSGLPAGRLGTTADVASVVLFLASDHADFISGDIVGVDGGVVPVV